MIGLALFVYKRPKETKQVIDSIERNHFEKIYVFQDGLKDEADRENWESVSELVKKISFAETEIHISKKNKGLANSIIDGMNYVFERHEMAIALEDDIVLSYAYKDLAETLFEKYGENKKVMAICGGGVGTVIPEGYEYDIYFNYRMSSVAFGTWRDRWIGFERNPSMLKEIYSDSQKREMLRNSGNDIEKMVFYSLTNKIDTWATYWELYQISQSGYHVVPVDGYATDIGRTGGGTNSKTCTVRHDVELNGEKKEQYKLPDDIILNDMIIQDTRDLMDIAENKFPDYFDVLCAWMKVYQRNQSVLKYFDDKKIDRIYVYGTGKLAEFLWHDISSHVEIAGYIVEMRQEDKYKGKMVFDMKNHSNMENLPIVVTPFYDMAFIRHFFRKCKIENEMIRMDDIVEYVLNGENGC